MLVERYIMRRVDTCEVYVSTTSVCTKYIFWGLKVESSLYSIGNMYLDSNNMYLFVIVSNYIIQNCRQ